MNIELARVQAVNVRDYTVDVLTEVTSKPLIGVPIMTPLNHPEHMGGINFLPEPGSSCYICFADDGSYFVLGFFVTGGLVDPAVSPGPTFTGGRDPLEPGDICMATVDGNSVIVRRGGLVQIGSNGLCQRLYIPGRNIIRDYFQRYHGVSPLGEIEWGHAELTKAEDLDNGNTAVAVRYNIKRKIQEDVTEKPYTLELRFGVLNDSNVDTTSNGKNHLFANDGLKAQTGIGLPTGEGTLSFTIYNHNDNANKVVYAFQLSRQGDTFVMSDGHVHMEFAKTVYVYAGDNITIEAGGGKVVTVRVSSGGQIHLGKDNASDPAVLGNELKSLLANLIDQIAAHAHAAPGTSPPVNAAAFTALKMSDVISGKILSKVVKLDDANMSQP